MSYLASARSRQGCRAVLPGRIFCPALVLSLFILAILSPVVSAERLIFKSGKILEARVLEKTDDTVLVDHDGRKLYYETRLIETIDAKPPRDFSLEDALIEKEGVSGDFEKGLFLASERKFESAYRTFREILRQDPSDDNARESLHILEDLKSGVISGDFAQAIFEGTFFFLKQRYEAASRAFQRAIALKPDALELYYNLGNLYVARKLYAEAIPYFEKLLDVNPRDAEAIFGLGVSYFSLNQFHKAADYFERYLILDPSDAEARGLLGAAYYALGREDEAMTEFKMAQDISSEGVSDDVRLRDDRIHELINSF